MNSLDTICALSTPSGSGAIGLVRISGPQAITIVNQIFTKDLNQIDSHKATFGLIKKGEEQLDEVVVIPFKNGKSYTGEDLVEINCHGSSFIINEILKLLIQKGCRTASPGEFTQRAFLNGKLDLSQAEAVGDLIASKSAKAHQIAMNQMRGGVSNEIGELREQLLHFASMMELELDFGEEDVEFADRSQFKALLSGIKDKIEHLIHSFAYGNAIKRGVPVAIVGAPNVGKSTLLNRLLNEEKAIVSNIAGTTRDTIEDEINIQGITFRFIDTAGLRKTDDQIESMGIERSYKKANEAQIILFLIDERDVELDIPDLIEEFGKNLKRDDIEVITVLNKSDALSKKQLLFLNEHPGIVQISAKENQNIDELLKRLVQTVEDLKMGDDSVVISNLRHYESLMHALEGVERIEEGFEVELPSDLIAMDIRQISHHLGEITGKISTDDILGNIFANFCIGK
ncbi:MAG: tRNA uridine-5-carboxymethylaminomethyl(34) synthesis GTPase MnmE [Crocinitomicaceae bacterium]|nr:tRNA uridine-5-carboxymethylaminomethyl(34) synthesis GTPase MnmE [Crocinitomicaceae bacterium]